MELVLAALLGGMACSLSAEDEASARSVEENAHSDAWLSGDPAQVLALYSDDAVLIPHHEFPVQTGREAIEEFWFPESSMSAIVTKYELVVDDVVGCRDLAVLHGRMKALEYRYEDVVFTNSNGTFLTVLKREDDQWKIWRRAWTDPAAQPLVED